MVCLSSSYFAVGWRRYEPALVLQQLRCTGVLETVKLRRSGYATRSLFLDFVHKYKSLAFRLSEDPPPTAATCATILQAAELPANSWTVGASFLVSCQWVFSQLCVVAMVCCCRSAIFCFDCCD
jgi:hypothetical protein